MQPATTTAVSAPAAVPFTERRYFVTLAFISSLFMLWAIAITMGDVLNKHFQNVLNVSKAESGLVQFSIFGAYAVMGIPAGLFMKRFGYKNGVLLGLGLYALGAFLFVPAANAGSFGFFRGALFVLACGLATLEAVAHPFMAALGDERTSDQRLNFAQSFNGLGAVVGPLLGSYFILNGTHVNGDLSSVKTLYVAIGSVILAIAVAFAFVKVPPLQNTHAAAAPAETEAGFYTGTAVAAPQPKKLLQHRHFVWAWVAQFLNVAAQGGTWAFFINYGVEKMNFSDQTAAGYFSLFMVMMMSGRFVGTFLMRYIAPNKLLTAFALANVLMCIIVAQSWGWPSFIALLLINFFFSIMFPTIFSLGIKDLGPLTPQASSILVMAVAGGAVFPYLMGKIANHDIAAAYYLPIICYAFIALFGARLFKVSNRGK
ncbi:L-fucose transporter [Hymenobacter roseosalivarius DSM 11622]|uniref:L-fucose transporter n=1 Tax=Hymenobacter roseosalivarius DSM 11622 TaxID=645990 RepID=A0A1W1VFV3_9BACT|nr:L-fucose:H+ symporter permease [Hymenobacter roseosalivarius]SMB92289.1 L-fucose transporter [Hymenobacter roseosalivarius DSM 11622]